MDGDQLKVTLVNQNSPLYPGTPPGLSTSRVRTPLNGIHILLGRNTALQSQKGVSAYLQSKQQ